MELKQYREKIEAYFDEIEQSVNYNKSVHWGLALSEESGEVIKALKKIHVFEEVTLSNLQNLKEELGDVLMCIIMVAYVNDISLEEVTELNFSKMMSRKEKLIKSRKKQL